MKNKLFLMTSAILLSLGMASCGGNEEEDVTITLWTRLSPSLDSIMDGYISEFEKANPHITVDSVLQSSLSYNELEDSVMKGFPTGNYPNLVQCYPDHVADYLSYDKVVNFEKYINDATYGLSSEDLNDYISSYIDEGKNYSKSGIYSMPFQKSSEALYYNADILLNNEVASGIVAIDNTINNGRPINATYLNNLSWEELFDKLIPAILDYDSEHNIINKTGENYAVLGYNSDDNAFITLSKQYGSKYVDIDANTGKGIVEFNNAKNKELMTRLSNSAKEHGFITGNSLPKNTYLSSLFTNENVLMQVNTTANVFYQFDEKNPMNVNVANIPSAAENNNNRSVINQGTSLCMLDKGTNENLAAWKFYKFLTNKENSLDWAIQSAYSPIRKSSLTSDEYIELCDETTKLPKTLDLLKAKVNNYIPTISDNLFASKAYVGSPAARTAVGSIVTQVVNKEFNLDNLDSVFLTAEQTARLAIK